MEKFLGDGEIPIYMDLKFDVGVNIIIGLLHFPPMTAPFDKSPGPDESCCWLVKAGGSASKLLAMASTLVAMFFLVCFLWEGVAL